MGNKKLGKFILGAGITAGAAAISALVSRQVTKALVGEAFDRNEPDIVKNVSAKKFDEYFEKEPYKSSIPLMDVVKAIPMEEWEITSFDGLKLKGHFYRHENAKRVIIAMHGWRSTWFRDFCTLVDFLHNTESHVLFVEQRGQGASEGEYMGFGLTERYDCLDWAKKVNEEYSDLPLYLCGISMGATTVLMATGLELPENVKGVISDCAFTSISDIFSHVAKSTLHISFNLLKNDVNNLSKAKINATTEDYSTVDALKDNKIPVLFIHGTDDGFVPVTMTYENYKACTAEKRLLVVPGADHGASYMIDKKAYEKAVKKFFKDFD